MPKGIPLTEEEIDRRRHEIFHSSVALILKQGFAGTSMQEIAEAAGVGKSTLYDYFPTKDHVLLFVFEEELDKFAGTGGRHCRSGNPGAGEAHKNPRSATGIPAQ